MSIRLVWAGYWPRGRFFWEHRNSAWRVFWCGPIGLVLGESLSIKKALVSTAKALVVAAILTTLGVLLVGCGAEVVPTAEVPRYPSVKAHYDIGQSGDVYEVELRDGTICAVLDAMNGGGSIDCNWRSPE